MKTKFLLISLLCIGLLSCETDNKRENEKDSSNIKENLDTKDYIKNGALQGVFSVSETKQVRFSQGNLQYQASTDTWRFAEHQYDIVGMGYGQVYPEVDCYVGGTVPNSDNREISSTYSGWIDLFCWGTSGYHNSSDVYNINYYPYSFLAYYDSNCEYNKWGYGPSTNQSSPNLTGESANYDWGVYNAISNGGNQAGLWRTLTGEEWKYLLLDRPSAMTKSGIAYVNGMIGLMLLPDNWTLPRGVKFTSGIDMSDYDLPNYDWLYNDDLDIDYEEVVNIYTDSEWALMESAGAVFLPTAGAGGGETEVNYVGDRGFYWTSTAAHYMEDYSDEEAIAISVDLSYLELTDLGRYWRCSVRLVQDVE